MSGFLRVCLGQSDRLRDRPVHRFGGVYDSYRTGVVFDDDFFAGAQTRQEGGKMPGPLQFRNVDYVLSHRSDYSVAAFCMAEALAVALPLKRFVSADCYSNVPESWVSLICIVPSSPLRTVGPVAAWLAPVASVNWTFTGPVPVGLMTY